MLALELTFLAGRYHATPWNRHVNEGAVAWPPEPWRIIRALIATWHHKIKHSGKYDVATVEAMIGALAADLPEYALPAASHSHTRHYMPQFAAGKTSLIFDAFTAVDRAEPLGVVWPRVDLTEDQRSLLDDLLAGMGYLGRADSWVEAKRTDAPPRPNCVPSNEAIDADTGEIKGELVTLYAPLSSEEYQALRARFLVDKKSQKKFTSTLPESLLDALSVDTSDLRKLGWSLPPAARKVSYVRPLGALRPRRTIQHATHPRVTAVSFVLSGKPLPRVEDTLRIGELIRVATMSQCKRVFGEENIPSIFSGHGLPKNNRHGHAFYLPWDSDDDGRLDRVLVYVPDGMGASEQQALVKLQRLWERGGNEWRLVFEGSGSSTVAEKLARPSVVWESITPYLHPWHVKKRFNVADQIRRECRKRGFAEPILIEAIDMVNVGKGRVCHPIHFQRLRSRRGLTQPDRAGRFLRLTFADPIAGPLALGFSCHYGLGMFKPVG